MTLWWWSAQVTLLREYCQGPNEMMYVLPTGGYDARKHSTLQDCAAAELSEEVRPSLHHLCSHPTLLTQSRW